MLFGNLCCLHHYLTGIGSSEGASEAINSADLATIQSELAQCGCVCLIIFMLCMYEFFVCSESAADIWW